MYGHRAAADALGREWKGYLARISSENDKQGCSMAQGVLTHDCVCLLLSKGHSKESWLQTKEDQRERANQFAVSLWMPILHVFKLVSERKKKKGEKGIPGLTGPKRASRICTLFSLSKEDAVCQYM